MRQGPSPPHTHIHTPKRHPHVKPAEILGCSEPHGPEKAGRLRGSEATELSYYARSLATGAITEGPEGQVAGEIVQVHTPLGPFCLVSWDPTLLHRLCTPQLLNVDDNKQYPLSFIGSLQSSSTGKRCKWTIISLPLAHSSKILNFSLPLPRFANGKLFL